MSKLCEHKYITGGTNIKTICDDCGETLIININSEFAKRGGDQTLKKHGVKHYSRIGKLSRKNKTCKEYWALPFHADHVWQADHHNLPSGNCIKCGASYYEYHNKFNSKFNIEEYVGKLSKKKKV